VFPEGGTTPHSRRTMEPGPDRPGENGASLWSSASWRVAKQARLESPGRQAARCPIGWLLPGSTPSARGRGGGRRRRAGGGRHRGLSGRGYATLCDEICSSSFHRPPSLRRLYTITKCGVPVLSAKETSTATVDVVPSTSSTVSSPPRRQEHSALATRCGTPGGALRTPHDREDSPSGIRPGLIRRCAAPLPSAERSTSAGP
jgi:hypothetical protein